MSDLDAKTLESLLDKQDETMQVSIQAQQEFVTEMCIIREMVRDFYTATMTNAKSRDENRALKKAILGRLDKALGSAP